MGVCRATRPNRLRWSSFRTAVAIFIVISAPLALGASIGELTETEPPEKIGVPPLALGASIGELTETEPQEQIGVPFSTNIEALTSGLQLDKNVVENNLFPKLEEAVGNSTTTQPRTLPVVFNNAMQPLVEFMVAGQTLKLVFDTAYWNTALFTSEDGVCSPSHGVPCFSRQQAVKDGTLKFCQNVASQQSPAVDSVSFLRNFTGRVFLAGSGLVEQDETCADQLTDLCIPGGAKYLCDKDVKDEPGKGRHFEEVPIDGFNICQRASEVEVTSSVRLTGRRGPAALHQLQDANTTLAESNQTNFSASNSQVDLPSVMASMFRGKLTLQQECLHTDCPGDEEKSKSKGEHYSLYLPFYEQASGVLGASNISGTCRSTSLWLNLIEIENVTKFSIDFDSPVEAIRADGPRGVGKIVFNHIDEKYSHKLFWSQTKQTTIDDGLPEFLMYHLEVCGVDLLFNTSSNWLAMVGTAGPCLSLPAFLFDRLRTRVPLECPFGTDEEAHGQLCSIKRDDGDKLPSLSFALEDVQQPMPPRLRLPLERLVYKNESGHEILCVSRLDNSPTFKHPFHESGNMWAHQIVLGTMAISGLYTVVDLENKKVGFAEKGDVEASDAVCLADRTCVGEQIFYPPANLCEDPTCGVYLLMTLDDETKTCKWFSVVPFVFGSVLCALVVLDLLGHRMYKLAIKRASESGQ